MEYDEYLEAEELATSWTTGYLRGNMEEGLRMRRCR